jgi:hypothetical protein
MRAQLDRHLKLADRVVEASLVGQGIAKAAIGDGKIRVELQCLLQRVDREVVFAAREMDASKREVAVGVLVIELDRVPGGGQSLVHPLRVGLSVEIDHAEDDRIGQPRIGEGELGIDFYRPPQQLLGPGVALGRELVEFRDPELVEVPGSEILARPPLGTPLLGEAELGLDAGGDELRGFVLQVEDVDDVPVEAFRPDAMLGLRVDDLDGDAKTGPGLAQAAGDHVVGVQLLADDADAVVGVAEREGGVAGDDGKPAVLGERRDDVLGDAVGDIVLLRIPVEVGERKDRHARSGREWRRHLVAVLRSIRRRGRFSSLDRPDEAKTAAVHGCDHALGGTVVAERAPRRLDLAAECGVRDDPVAPDRREDLLLGYDPVVVADEKHQQIEDLRLDRNAFAGPAELEEGGIELERFEADDVGACALRSEVGAIGLDRPADVLHPLFAERHELDRDIGSDVVVDLLRQHHAARLGDAFEPGRDVDAVAIDVAALDDHVTEMDTDPQMQLVPLADGGVARTEAALDLDRALQCLDDARELDQRAVAHQLDRAPRVALDCRVDDVGPDLLEAAQRPRLVALHQAAEADHVHRDDGRELPFH